MKELIEGAQGVATEFEKDFFKSTGKTIKDSTTKEIISGLSLFLTTSLAIPKELTARGRVAEALGLMSFILAILCILKKTFPEAIPENVKRLLAGSEGNNTTH